MATPGPKPRPNLTVVREGNPGKRKRPDGVHLPPTRPAEPDWRDWFPATSGRQGPENKVCRDRARVVWNQVVDPLDHQGVLASIDTTLLIDLSVCVARILQCERDISRNGLWAEGDRGAVKNPSATIVNGYRTQFKAYIAELGLSPSARTRLLEVGGDGGDNDSPFDI